MSTSDQPRHAPPDYQQIREQKSPSNQVNVHTIACVHAEDLIDELLPSRTSWLRHRSSWRFRGQSDSTWDLQASVFREVRHRHAGNEERIAAIMHLVPGQVHSPAPAPRNHVERELSLVTEYLENVERLGLTVPFDSPRLRSGEPAFEAVPTDFPPNELRGAFALAQHYGIPTRLLDWTYKPLVAAYFAAVPVARRSWEEGHVEDGKELAVWAINSKLKPFLRSLDPGVEFVSVPTVSNPNLHAQGGAFTLVRFKQGNAAASLHHPPALDALLADITPESMPEAFRRDLPALVKLTLPATEARSLLRILANHQVTAAEVYPGHRGAAAALIERKWMQWYPPGQRS